MLIFLAFSVMKTECQWFECQMFRKLRLMRDNGTAYFVQYPRIMEELNIIHSLDWEKPYQVVKEIYLQAIDFENFVTDMTVDRQFIEDNASLCEDGEVKKCLMVRGRDPRIGILVIPDAERYVGWAALVREE